MRDRCCDSKSFDSVHWEKYVVSATLEEVARLTEFLKKLMPKCLSEEQGYAVELGIAEALTNIALHGYAGEEGGSITVFWREQATCLRISIMDNGLPIPEYFLEKAADATFDFDATDICNLPQSGFGLTLIAAIFDVVSYERNGNVNCMCLEKIF